VAFIFCFFFAKQIYNVLVWPFVWGGGRGRTRSSSTTALLEYFLTQLKLALFGAAFISFPICRNPDLQVRGSGPLQARARRPSCLI